jgi:hypothetical protein
VTPNQPLHPDARNSVVLPCWRALRAPVNGSALYVLEDASGEC